MKNLTQGRRDAEKRKEKPGRSCFSAPTPCLRKPFVGNWLRVRHVSVCVAILCLFANLCVVTAADSARVIGQSTIPTQATVGTPITYEVKLLVEDRHRVTALPVSTDDAHLEIGSSTVETMDAENGEGVQITVRFPVRAFSPGEHTIPAVDFRITDPNGSESNLVADTYPLRITSVLPDDAEDILDIKPVRLWQERNWLLWTFLGSIVLLAAAIAWAVYRRRQQRTPTPVVPDAPPKPAHAVALEALAELEQSDWVAHGEFQPFFVRLSEIAREYLEGRYQIPALELTTREVLAALAPVDPGWENRRRLSECLTMSDLVKFAKYQPSKPDSHQQLEQIREFVQQTRSRMLTFAETVEQTGAKPSSPPLS